MNSGYFKVYWEVFKDERLSYKHALFYSWIVSVINTLRKAEFNNKVYYQLSDELIKQNFFDSNQKSISSNTIRTWLDVLETNNYISIYKTARHSTRYVSVVSSDVNTDVSSDVSSDVNTDVNNLQHYNSNISNISNKNISTNTTTTVVEKFEEVLKEHFKEPLDDKLKELYNLLLQYINHDFKYKITCNTFNNYLVEMASLKDIDRCIEIVKASLANNFANLSYITNNFEKFNKNKSTNTPSKTSVKQKVYGVDFEDKPSEQSKEEREYYKNLLLKQ